MVICLMDDIFGYLVDCNLYWVYVLVMYDNGMIRLELVNDWVDKVEGEDGELVYFL